MCHGNIPVQQQMFPQVPEVDQPVISVQKPQDTRILIAEDNEMNALIVKKMLAAMGFREIKVWLAPRGERGSDREI